MSELQLPDSGPRRKPAHLIKAGCLFCAESECDLCGPASNWPTLPDALPDCSAETIKRLERLERQNERLRAANRLLAITRDCCADELIRLRERVEQLEQDADWAEQSAFMHERETEILREQMTAHGVEPRVGLTITGEIVRVPDALPDSAAPDALPDPFDVSECPHGEPRHLHDHHDGCPSCHAPAQAEKEGKASRRPGDDKSFALRA